MKIEFEFAEQRQQWIANWLKVLAMDVVSGLYGEDGLGLNPEGYCLVDVVSDMQEGYEPYHQ